MLFWVYNYFMENIFTKVEEDGQTKLDFNLVDEETKKQKTEAFEDIGRYYIEMLNKKYPYAKISDKLFKCISRDKFEKEGKEYTFEGVEEFFKEVNEDYKPDEKEKWFDR